MISQVVPRQFFNAEKLGLLVWLNTVEVSSEGEMILLSVSRRDVANNRLIDEFFVLSPEGDQLHHLNGSSPVFSPDAKHIAFEDDGGLHVYDLQKRQFRKLATIYSSEYFMGHMAEKNFIWSPDSKSIAFISADPYKDSHAAPQQVISRLLYKTKGGRGRDKYTDDRLSHVWIVSLDNPEAYCITPGEFNEHSITWSPDGSAIAFISDRSGNHDRTHKNDLLTVNVQSREIQTLVTGMGTRFKPKWSPRGDLIAYLGDDSAFTSKDSPAPDVQVYCIAPDGKQPKNLTSTLDRRTDNLKWSTGGDKIYFTAGNHGSTSLYSADILTAAIQTVINGNFQVKDYSVYGDENIAFIKNAVNAPDELYISSQGSEFKRITTFSDPLLSGIQLADAETFWFKAEDGISIQGWLMKPAAFDNSMKYPVLLVIHGGPHNMYGYEFDEKMQWLSAQGYGVVFFNPRGSSGYGQEFTNGNLLNWGGKDYTDIMSGMDYVLNNYPWMDSNRLGVTGQSYGGYMTNWIISQSDLFKAAVSDGGISNLISFAGTSLYHCLVDAEFNGDTWNNYDLLWQWSPLKYVKNVKTPTLFLHGEKDNEVPVTQAEEMFSAMKRIGVETMFVRYIDEGHGWRPDLLPANRVDLYERMTNWFNNHLKPNNQ